MRSSVIQCLEKTGIVLTALMVIVLILNFTLMHTVTTHTPARFLFSSALLGLIAVFIRFGAGVKFTSYRIIYRIALTMTIWSLAYSVMPFSESALYILSLPMIYYWFRMEYKGSQGSITSDDLITAGILGFFSFFIYIQQQPLQMILFPGKALSFSGYYWNSPVIIFAGFLFIRIKRYGGWKDFLPFGLLCVLTGVSMLIGGFLDIYLGVQLGAVIIFCVIAHGLFLFNSSYPEKNKITRLAGVISLSEKTEVMKKLLFGIIILFHAGIFALLTSFTWHHLSLWIWLLLIWMLGYTENSFLVSVGFVESAILFAYATVLWPLIPVKTIITAFLVLMVCGTILRKEKIEKKWYPDIIFILHFSIAMFFLIKGGFFHPFSLLIIAGFAGCYVSVPDRPVNHGKALIYLWPLLSGVFVFCIFRKFSAGLFGLWAMINFILPCIFYSFFSSNRGMDIWQRNGWMMIGNALEKRDFFLKNQSYGSLFLIIVSGIILGSAGIVSVLWIIPVLFTLTVFIYRNMNLAFEKKSIFHAMQAEWGIIGFLFLLRTYIAIKGLMGWTSAMDVYLLLGVAFICAGIRELMKREIPEISIHLDRSMNFYAIAGWIYSLILRIFYGVGFVGIAGSVVLSILYYWQGKVKNRSQLIVSAVMANIAVLFWFSDLAFTNALFYVCPVAISMSVLAQMFRNRLTIAQLYNIRLASSLSMLGTATAYHVLEFQGSYIMPLVASIIAITGAVIGIALQIRIYLYSGTAFFFFNAITLLVHVITKQPAGHIKLIAGVAFLIIGILLTASFLIFQMKRQMILDKIEALKLELQGWE